MIPRFCFVLFVVPYISCSAVPNIDQQLLQDVFGPAAAASTLRQVAAVKPINDTLVDLDYWDNPDNDQYTPAAADYDKFDWTLTKRVAASSDKNFLLSPLGLKLSLAILTEAATSLTQSELVSALGFDPDRKVVRTKFANIVESLQKKSTHYILNLGSRIYIDKSAIPRQKFAGIAQEFYKTELTKVNFTEPAVAARDINSWVAGITEGRIASLVDEDDVAGAVVLILNTIFFKGSWRHQFAPNATKNGVFYLSPREQKPLPMMNVKDKFYYAESAKYDAKILRMPYLGMKFAMYIIVPNSVTGLPRVLNDLNDLRPELNYLQERTVEVTLPKFTFEYTAILDGVLKELGVRQAFEDTASFPGISRGQLLSQRLKVSKVLQRSGIEVNELGSIAYSATEISLVNKFGEDEEINEVVLANKPFLFFIQDEATRQLLFTGRVSDPAAVVGSFHFLTLTSLQCLDCLSDAKSEYSRLNFFDIDLLRYSAEDQTGNIMVSPASVKSILAVILEGARGVTEAEIRSALRLTPNKDDFRQQLNLYLSAMRVNSTGVSLHNANAVFVSSRYSVKSDYEAMLKRSYLTEVTRINFADPTTTANTVNKWVDNKTKGLIPVIVEPASINPSSQMLLANAIFFKGLWRQGFNPSLTRGMCFYNNDVCKTVAMMDLNTELNYAYVDNLRAHAVELPYVGDRYSMILLVPQDRDGCVALLRDLPYMSLPAITKLLDPTDVQLFMPKFTVDYVEDLVLPLKSMRVRSLFSSSSNLTGIFNGESPQINSIFHKAFMSVDEVGTVAAAASSAMIVPLISSGVQLRVDRPFIFFIRDNELGLVLFEGKIDDPMPYEVPILSNNVAKYPQPQTPFVDQTQAPATVTPNAPIVKVKKRFGFF
ncbi:uncharacterized protein LOC128678491 [Plodia interpunctella]|uniref:uncharacterized protein LOC128678491 n=1 Tax=Plodia interpunctella TaxID=58824 RepID=UPI002368A1E8|nr:uncharacterized protein LOC128678491 [Plodia interpunctella]